MTVAIKISRKHFSENFKFLRDFLAFSSDGLIIEPNCARFYARRLGTHTDPAQISFSIFVHTLWVCYSHVTTDFCWFSDGQRTAPALIGAFWGEHDMRLSTSVSPAHPLLACYIVDWSDPSSVPLVEISAADAVVTVITTRPVPNHALCWQTPFGWVSCFSKLEWEQYCADYLSKTRAN